MMVIGDVGLVPCCIGILEMLKICCLNKHQIFAFSISLIVLDLLCAQTRNFVPNRSATENKNRVGFHWLYF